MRGMVKWKPFNSLIKESDIYFLAKARLKECKPIISKDRIVDIDYTLREALKFNLKIEIKYWDIDKMIFICGFIEKVNVYEKYILINNKRMYFVNVINIKIID